MDTSGKQPSVLIKTDFEASQEGMPVPGKDHILVAVEPNPHGVLRMLGCQRGQRGGKGRLRFLAAEATTHPGTLDYYFVRRQMQDVRDHGLNLGRMLSRGNFEHRPSLTGFRPGGLSFQVKVFLAAQFKRSTEHERRITESFSNLAAPDVVGLIMKTARREGLLQS